MHYDIVKLQNVFVSKNLGTKHEVKKLRKLRIVKKQLFLAQL